MDDLERVARDEEEDDEEEQVRNRVDDSPSHGRERVEDVLEQPVRGAPCPGKQAEHVLEIDEGQAEDDDRSGAEEHSPERHPDLLRPDDLKRFDSHGLHALTIGRLERRLRPPRKPDDERDERRQDHGRDAAAHRRPDRRLPAARLPIVRHGRANGVDDCLREYLGTHRFVPGIGIEDDHHAMAVGHDRGAGLDLDCTHGVGRHGPIGGERLDPARDARSALVRREHRRAAHAEQHGPIDHDRCRRQLGLGIGASSLTLVGCAHVGRIHRHVEGERADEQRGDDD